jgi:hypothetical protein
MRIFGPQRYIPRILTRTEDIASVVNIKGGVGQQVSHWRVAHWRDILCKGRIVYDIKRREASIM